MARAVVALGSNLGDRLGQLRDGLTGLATLGRVVAVSSLYDTEPVGGPDQGRYLNAVAVVDSDLEPVRLLAGLREIERYSARMRDVHWGPRTLDLDLIAFDDRQVDLPELQVPHPRAHQRRFVLAPLQEVAPEVRLADGRTAAEALARITGQPVTRLEGQWASEAPRLGREAPWWVAGQFSLLTLWLIVTVATAGTRHTGRTAAGAFLTVAGLVLAVAAAAVFGRPIPPSPQPRPDKGVVRSGAYRLVRHPMYGGIILTTTGVALAAGSGWGLVVTFLTAAFLWAKSRREERILGVVFPDYQGYAAEVRRRFIPGLW